MSDRPFSDTEWRNAQAEAHRLLTELLSSEGLRVRDVLDNGWVRDPQRPGTVVSNSRAVALIVALTELAANAVDYGYRERARLERDMARVLSDARYVTRREYVSRLGFE